MALRTTSTVIGWASFLVMRRARFLTRHPEVRTKCASKRDGLDRAGHPSRAASRPPQDDGESALRLSKTQDPSLQLACLVERNVDDEVPRFRHGRDVTRMDQRGGVQLLD